MAQSEAKKDAIFLAFTGVAPFVLLASAWARGGSWSAVAFSAFLWLLFFRHEPCVEFELKKARMLYRTALPPAEDGSSREFALHFGGMRFDAEGNAFYTAVPWSGVVVDWPDRRVWARGFGVALKAGRTMFAGSGLGPFCWGVVQRLPEQKDRKGMFDCVVPDKVYAARPVPPEKKDLKSMRSAPARAAGSACLGAAKKAAALCLKAAGKDGRGAERPPQDKAPEQNPAQKPADGAAGRDGGKGGAA